MTVGEKGWTARCPAHSDVAYILPYRWIGEVNVAQFFTLGGVELQTPATSHSGVRLWRARGPLGVQLCRSRMAVFFPRVGRHLSFPRFARLGGLLIGFSSCTLLVLTIGTGRLDGTRLWIVFADRQVGGSLVTILVEHVPVSVSGLEVKHINQPYSGRMTPDSLAWFNVVHQPTMENRARTL